MLPIRDDQVIDYRGSIAKSNFQVTFWKKGCLVFFGLNLLKTKRYMGPMLNNVPAEIYLLKDKKKQTNERVGGRGSALLIASAFNF